MSAAENLIVIDDGKIAAKAAKATKTAKTPAPQFKLEDTVDGRMVIVKKKSKLADFMRSAVGYVFGHYAALNANDTYAITTLIERQARLRAYLEDEAHKEPVKCLFDMLEAEEKIAIAYIEKRIAQGVVKFTDLKLYFSKGSEIIVGDAETGYAGVVEKAQVRESMFGPYLLVELHAIVPTAKGYGKHVITAKMGGFSDLMPLAKLNIRKITEAEKDKLTERGVIFRNFVEGPHYAAYTGVVRQPSWSGDRMFRADGRIMIDSKAFQKTEPNLFDSCSFNIQSKDDSLYDDDSDDDNEDGGPDGSFARIPNADLWMCSNILFGFSFSAKQWGIFDVANLREIEWRDDAFDKVVLPSEDKEVVHALVKHNAGAFNDIVDGKGGGTIFLLHGRPGQGKAQPLTSLVHGPQGMIPMREVQVGSLVTAADGTHVRVLGTYPQGHRQVYKLTFADGRVVRADADHLWRTKLKLGRVAKSDGTTMQWDTVTTRRLFERSAKNRSRVYVPLCAPVQLPECNLPIDSWLLGIMLGDGFFKSGHCSISNDDEEVIVRVQKLLPNGYDLHRISEDKVDYRLRMTKRTGNETHWLKDALGDLGLYGLGSHERFIPDAYKRGSIEQRLAVVQGLMDSDGYVCKDGCPSFTSTSERLAKDFQEIIWSLGGVARITEKTTKYVYKGEPRVGRPAYTVRVRMNDPTCLTTLTRKRARFSEKYQYSDTLALELVSIEKDGIEETKCILIDHPDHLYLTDGYVVTHNTLLAETTAEVLHRPLYTISVGELGVSPDDLEERLRTILDLATEWNAVLLLDEADIFLEARDEHNIIRNAMVGVFLRLLEYQSSCIFLTTNRVKNIDEAFYSRIAVALQFDDADEDKLAAIWENLLGAAKLSHIACARELAREFPKLNGRQIKNAIRLAQTLATSRGVTVTEDHLRRTVSLGSKFLVNFGEGGQQAA